MNVLAASSSLSAFENEAALQADLLESGFVAEGAEDIARNNNLEPGAKTVLAAMSVVDGKYGAVKGQTFEAKTITYSETFKVTAATPSFEASDANWKVTMAVTVDGGTAAKYYYYWNGTVRTEEQLNQLPLGSEAYYYYYTATNLPALTYYSSNPATMQFAVVVESTEGQLSKPFIITVNKPAAE